MAYWLSFEEYIYIYIYMRRGIILANQNVWNEPKIILVSFAKILVRDSFNLGLGTDQLHFQAAFSFLTSCIVFAPMTRVAWHRKILFSVYFPTVVILNSL